MIMGENIRREGEKRIPLQWVKFNFKKINFRLGFRASLEGKGKRRIKLRLFPFRTYIDRPFSHAV